VVRETTLGRDSEVASMITPVRTVNTPFLVGLALVASVFVVLMQLITVGNADLKDTVLFAGFAVLLLTASIATRGYGFLIAALAFAGLSAAKYAVMSGEDSGGAVLLGPGIGFLVAYLIGALVLQRRKDLWPLLPGVGMTLLGGLLVFGGEPGTAFAGQIVWLVLILGIGGLILAGAAAVRRSQAAAPKP
jgi:hypothetical protein